MTREGFMLLGGFDAQLLRQGAQATADQTKQRPASDQGAEHHDADFRVGRSLARTSKRNSRLSFT